ncbi:MAG: glycosyltransferase family 2 protein [Arcobacter sp.]|nr:glycosyltransferase family 2 protein [Arcobacter sp.]
MSSNLNKISVVIIVKNGEAYLSKVLDALNSFDDVVLYDNGSIDNTKNIALKYSNVNLVEGDFFGFGPTKNKAATYAKNDWILSLDADEVVSNELLKSLNFINLEKKDIYKVQRHNYYKDKKIKYCGWGREEIVRLYDRKMTSFNDNMVHEKILLKDDCLIKVIDGELKHYPYSSISQFIQKADSYSSIFAEEKVGMKKSSPFYAFTNGCFSFFKTYIIKRGFLDGYIGLVISVSHAVTNFYKYIKLYEKNID